MSIKEINKFSRHNRGKIIYNESLLDINILKLSENFTGIVFSRYVPSVSLKARGSGYVKGEVLHTLTLNEENRAYQNDLVEKLLADVKFTERKSVG